jgi:pyruvate,orthophosphate dikinase
MVVENPTPEDIPVIISADGLLAAKGGSTSHAAVAINGIDDRRMAAVMSAVGLRVDLQRREAVFHDPEGVPIHTVRVGDVVSIHGTSGEVYVGPRELRRGHRAGVDPSRARTRASTASTVHRSC